MEDLKIREWDDLLDEIEHVKHAMSIISMKLSGKGMVDESKIVENLMEGMEKIQGNVLYERRKLMNVIPRTVGMPSSSFDGIVDPPPLTCICGRRFESVRKLMYHVESCPAIQNLYLKFLSSGTCPICGWRGTFHGLRQHSISMMKAGIKPRAHILLAVYIGGMGKMGRENKLQLYSILKGL